MLRTWLEPHEISVPDNLIQSIGGIPLVSQVLFQRGITDPDSAKGFLSPEYYRPTPAVELPDLEKVADILYKAISGKKKIGVWGDFDVDGQTSTTVFVSALRDLGGNVIFHIPVRGAESHGIGLTALQQFLRQDVKLILTCDTGVTSHESIDFAQNRGVPVLVTDHHDLPEQLPTAEALVNPKMLPLHHPLSTLPGVGVAYKVVEQLLHMNGEDEKSSQYLDLVALGIVADIALLKWDTRYLLQRGLDVLRNTQREGLLSIMELVELNQSNLTEEHIAFILAPRMNALGRLDDANQIVELLTTSDRSRARILALELEGMNAQRKLLCDQVYQAALVQLSLDPKLLDYPILVLSHPSWPAGVIGIVASRLMEQYHRPVILLSSPPGEDARGSARSTEPVNITSAIAANRELVKEFGGHPMAAGLAIDPDCIPEFRRAISRTILNMGVGIQKEKDLQIDGYLTLPELSLDLVEDLERLAPFGAGNPPLVLATRNLRLTGYAAVGRNDEHLQLTIEDELGHTQRSIWWQGAGFTLPETPFDLAYSVRASTYRGQRDVQIEWVDYRLVEAPTISLSSKKLKIEVVDLREETEPLEKLLEIKQQEELIIWGESDPPSRITFLDRFSLYPSNQLAIWTIPPGQNELRGMLQKVKPNKVYLFGINPGMDEPEAFLKRLLGLLKYRIKSAVGITSLSSLAVATAQRTSTIKIGLEWLEAHGHVSIFSIQDDEIRVEAGTKMTKKDTRTSSTRLNSALAESAAFRRYFLITDKDHLVTNE
ncbi:MAG: single-stranded-DNA-specific exonuclease RecJ [Chloroflexi bacterium RBG_16_47_49]|nr:MAG: single-stranded-DNA-specific exonuclease RecJ [Chloroflexi bacterium RBG_16_47_49]